MVDRRLVVCVRACVLLLAQDDGDQRPVRSRDGSDRALRDLQARVGGVGWAGRLGTVRVYGPLVSGDGRASGATADGDKCALRLLKCMTQSYA